MGPEVRTPVPPDPSRVGRVGFARADAVPFVGQRAGDDAGAGAFTVAVPPRPHPHDQCHFVLLSVCEPLIRLGLLVANPCIHHLTDYHLLHPSSFISTLLFLDLLLENACTESPKDQESKTLAINSSRLRTAAIRLSAPNLARSISIELPGLVTSPRSTSFSTHPSPSRRGVRRRIMTRVAKQHRSLQHVF